MRAPSPSRDKGQAAVGLQLERRKQGRVQAGGKVLLVLTEAGQTRELETRLVDLSARGFQVVHHHRGLYSGQQVWFRWAYGEGKACVTWIRISGDVVATGLRVLTHKRAQVGNPRL